MDGDDQDDAKAQYKEAFLPYVIIYSTILLLFFLLCVVLSNKYNGQIWNSLTAASYPVNIYHPKF